jgi:UDPglucose--hexose-1-phosphate uridylyltransferase
MGLVFHHRSKIGRAKRKHSGVQLPEYDPECYLCPGNVRANGEVNLPTILVMFFEMIFCGAKRSLLF